MSVAFSISLLLHAAALSFDLPVPHDGATTRPPRLEARLRPQEIAPERTTDIAPVHRENTAQPALAPLSPVAAPGEPEPFPSARPPSPAAPEETIVDARRLDVRPAIKTRTMPEYPATLPKGTTGSVVIELQVSRTGRVDSVRIVSGSGFQEMDASAIAAFQAAEFFPGQVGGVAVTTRIRIEVDFDGSD